MSMGAPHENIREKRRNITMAVNISNYSKSAKSFLGNKVSCTANYKKEKKACCWQAHHYMDYTITSSITDSTSKAYLSIKNVDTNDRKCA
jgi:hypothetical protein